MFGRKEKQVAACEVEGHRSVVVESKAGIHALLLCERCGAVRKMSLRTMRVSDESTAP